MLHLLFMGMLVGFIAALVALPVLTARLVPWWGTMLIIFGELVFLRYALFKILGLMFGIFTSVGLRMGVRGMRGARVDVHSVRVVPPPTPDQIVKSESGSVDEDPDEDPDESGSVDEDPDDAAGDDADDDDDDDASEPDAPGTRFVKVDCTVTPSPKMEASDWPVKHYDAGSFTLSSEGFAWPKFPPDDDATRTGVLAAAAVVEGGTARPIAPDEQLLGSQRLELIFKCPPTLRGPAKLKFIVLPLATVEVPGT